MLGIKLILRKVAAITICIAFSVTMFAQDIIILKNGNDIQAIVIEVGTEDVKYKRFDNQNGPNYTLKKSDIFMIMYENGSKDVFNEIVTPAPAEVQQQTTFNQQTGFYNGNANSQQPISTLKYTFGNRISPYGSEKSPFLAGFLSFLIPGLGQFYNGDIGAGFLYLGCNIVCNSILISAISTDYYENTYIDGTKFTIGFVGALVVTISSIVNGSQMAKRVNIARGYRLGDNTYLKIQPAIIQQNNFLTTNKEYACGMNFCLNF
jgi:TM2 domain-containing membrane protein YozV